jgi:threonine/homoserine/homoserine lactone efflux protein
MMDSTTASALHSAGAGKIALITIVAAIGLGAISPGPSFIMVARTALASTPAHGRLAALGIGTASLTFSVAAVSGLRVAFLYAEWLFVL